MAFLCLHVGEELSQNFTQGRWTYWIPVLRSTEIFFPRTISRSFSLPTQLPSWCFSVELFAQFHPVARCLSPILTGKELIFHFEIKSPTLQNYKVSKYKSAPAFALKSYPRDLIGQSKSGRQMNFVPVYIAFGPRNGVFYREQLVIWPCVLIIIVYYNIELAPSVFTVFFFPFFWGVHQ